MNPFQKSQPSSTSPTSAEDARLLALYGTAPNKRRLLQDQLKERKFFDSGDYALSKAGKTSDTGVPMQTGKTHPRLKHISGLSSPVPRDGNTGVAQAQNVSRQRTKSMSLSPVEAREIMNGEEEGQGREDAVEEEGDAVWGGKEGDESNEYTSTMGKENIG